MTKSITKPKRILIAGATGYLGRHLVSLLLQKNEQYEEQNFFALARSANKLSALGAKPEQIRIAQVTQADTLIGSCDDCDVVISCLGITRQRDGLNYMDVDYQANLNLLLEAERAGVKKFIYISAFNAPALQHVRLLKAKERFAQRLLSSQVLSPCVIRPNGFFSDLEEIYHMAQRGSAYLFGKGHVRINPIHGADLAQFVLEAISRPETELNVGGPDVLSVKDITELAFSALNKTPNLTYLPDALRQFALAIARRLPESWTGPAEFFLTAMAQDNIAPRYGEHHLDDYYQQLAKGSQSSKQPTSS
ncbi:SDR family oxidoreductase [Motilimonas eburnea]|uniref:SDR family oxidoreductase n=1 Tax=Motilimonas eburnea TaxID=1737488 RepID=UPI001E500357|nr:SDR family oxidoreductase [Motilimonas eburnea]MCE2572656.1 SDR family oxidoreductase [Motilimonas eburnea]